MKIGQAIRKQGASLSFEFFPPKDKVGEDKLFQGISRLQTLNPTFVSVTYGAGGGTMKNTRQLVERIKQETALVPMPHLTCIDKTKEELLEILEDFRNLGIENVLALRGDPPDGAAKFNPPEGGYCFAKDLVELAASMSRFSIGVAVYPEGHCESPDLDADMLFTKQKIDAGADFAITQMFFDNRYFYNFMDRSNRIGIKIPIIPGIMPIADIGRITKFSKKCGATVPPHIIQRFEKSGASLSESRKIGIEVATEQCADLMKHGIRYFHFYTLNQGDFIFQVVSNLGLQIPSLN